MPATGRLVSQSVRAERIAELTRDYHPLPGAPDEFIGPDGQPRAHWSSFLNALTELDRDEIERRFDAADRHIRDAGVTYRAFDDTRRDPLVSERPWPLSHVPFVIPEAEWHHISRGVIQRAALLEKIVADIYGPGDLVRDGALPAAIVTGSPEFLRPVHGVTPPGGRFLQLFAVDLGRGPDGRWWALGDRTQAPSGAGYALENRIVLSRAMPEVYRRMNCERLAPFFEAMRKGLATMAVRSEPRICLLTPGPYSETYFEQAYLARYLGFLLVEGGDLVMRDNMVHVRTIAGLKRADVLWRRIDADFADPIELNSASQLGVPGLLEAVRAGQVAIANALGSGVLESTAMLSFMPRLARRLIGEDLLLPNVATWWCGQESERAHVLENFSEMAISSAFDATPRGFGAGQPIVGGEMSPSVRDRTIQAIGERGIDFVGQEVVKLSTTPVWENGRLTPRPFVLRVYAAATRDGWVVMPGGFCRVSDQRDARAVSMRAGAQSADVWVLAEKPVEQVTLLATSDNVRIRRIMGNLPSRAADNLFWYGRYLERTEATLRLIRALIARLSETEIAPDVRRKTLDRIAGMMVAWGAIPRKPAPVASLELANRAVEDHEQYGSAIALVAAARRAASVIRERLSLESWRLLRELGNTVEPDVVDMPTEAESVERVDRTIGVLAALSGLGQENMNRVAGWRFIELGRRVERGINTCRFARTFVTSDADAEELDVALDLIDSQITYRSRYLIGLARDPIADIIMLDPYNPRSVAFQVARIAEHLDALPVLVEDGMLEAPKRLALKLSTELAVTEARELDTTRILAIEQVLMALAEAVAERYFLQGPSAARAARLKGLA